MALPTPSQLSSGVALRVIDLLYQPLNTVLVQSGDTFSDAVFDPPDAPYLWLVERIVVQHTSTNPTQAFVFVGEASPQNLRDDTTAGNADVADYAAGIYVPPSQSLRIRWTAAAGLSVGSRGTATIQYRLMQRNA